MTIRLRTLVLIIGGVFAAAVATIVLVLTLSGPDTFTIKGTLNVAECGSAGYSDLLPGSQVEIVSADGTVIGTGTLNWAKEYSETEVPGAMACTTNFTVKEVPTGMDRYGVRVGNDNRGTLWKSEEEARDGYTLSIN